MTKLCRALIFFVYGYSVNRLTVLQLLNYWIFQKCKIPFLFLKTALGICVNRRILVDNEVVTNIKTIVDKNTQWSNGRADARSPIQEFRFNGGLTVSGIPVNGGLTVVGVPGLTHPRSEDVGYDGTYGYVGRISLCTVGGWCLVTQSTLFRGYIQKVFAFKNLYPLNPEESDLFYFLLIRTKRPKYQKFQRAVS